MKFCFFGNISNSLQGQTKGGGELQIALLAKALVLKGHEVVIIDPYAVKSFTTEEGIQLLNVPAWNKGIRGIRLFQYRIPALYKLLKTQMADYYYVRMRSYMHLLTYKAAQRNGAKFIIGLAHDLDVASFSEKFKYEYKPKFNLINFLTLWLPSDIVFNYLLRKADHITLQHIGQQPSSPSVQKKAQIFPTIFYYNSKPVVGNKVNDYFIHVGSMTILKGTANLHELVKIIGTKSKVVIVGQPCDNKSEEIYKSLAKMDNVILKGRLDHAETMRLISNASALISTSNYEGFPNIFLEAWSAGIPVISLKVNPGNVIDKYQLGFFCDGDLNRMKEIMDSNEARNMDKQKLISYVSEHHDFGTAAERFLNILGRAK